MPRWSAGHYGAALAIVFAVFILLFFFVKADRSGTTPQQDQGPLTEQTKP